MTPVQKASLALTEHLDAIQIRVRRSLSNPRPDISADAAEAAMQSLMNVLTGAAGRETANRR